MRQYLLAAILVGAVSEMAQAGVVPGTITIDFSVEDDGLTPLLNGQIIDTEFGNLFTLSSTGPNAGLGIFDTTSGVNSADPDLWVDTGNALILQSNNGDDDDNDGSFFFTPNDDAGGGTIFFDFLTLVHLTSIDLIDINGNNQAATLVLTDHNGLTRTYDVPSEWTGDVSQGDPGIGTLDLTTLGDQGGFLSIATATEDSGFDPFSVTQLAVTFQGSGALDNLTLVPAPSALIVLMSGLALGTRRRARRRAD